MKRIQCFPPRDARMCSLIRLVQDMDRTRQYWLDQRNKLNLVVGMRTLGSGRSVPVMKEGFHHARLQHLHARNEYRWAQRSLRKYLLEHPEVIRDPAPYPSCPSTEDTAHRIAAFYRRVAGATAQQPPDARRQHPTTARRADPHPGEVPGRVG